ncbi:hypothetical protein ACP4OV_004362 [Aristida adscensionis]
MSQSALDADVDKDTMCLDNVGKLKCSGQQHDNADVALVPSPLESPLLALQSVIEMMVASPSTMTRHGNEDGVFRMDEQRNTYNPDRYTDGGMLARVEVEQSPGVRPNVDDHMRNVLDSVDASGEEVPAEMQIDRMDSSTRAEQPVVDDQISCESWWSIPGLTFLPTDLELVLHYLKPKVLGLGLHEHHAVREGEDVHGTNADEITLDITNGDREQLGFFFVRKEHNAYANGCWYATPSGHWKVRRGAPEAIRHGGRVVAFKTTMDYYVGGRRPPHGRRTPWSMSEYALDVRRRHDDLRNIQQPSMNSIVVCKVRKRAASSASALSVRAKKWPVSARRSKLKTGRASKPKVRRLVVGRVVAVGGVLGKRKRHDLFY